MNNYLSFIDTNMSDTKELTNFIEILSDIEQKK